MGILDSLFGRDEEPKPRPAQQPGTAPAQSSDEQAIDRYRYMLKTAPPETIEQAHAEAFAKLTPQQRSMLLQQLSADLPDAERAAGAGRKTILNPWRAWRRVPKCANPARWSAPSAAWVVVAWEWAA